MTRRSAPLNLIAPTRAVGRPKGSKSKSIIRQPEPFSGKKDARAQNALTPPPTPSEPKLDDLFAIFGDNLWKARLAGGLKQSEVAEQAGLTQQRLSLIEAGNQNLTLKTMMRLAQAVDQNVSAMLQLAQRRRTNE